MLLGFRIVRFTLPRMYLEYDINPRHILTFPMVSKERVQITGLYIYSCLLFYFTDCCLAICFINLDLACHNVIVTVHPAGILAK